MDEMLYVAMTGAKQTEYAQAINNNNLANVSTTGFRADLHAFTSLPVEGPGFDSRVNAQTLTYGTNLEQGVVSNTGRSLDVAIQGEGYIAVQAPDGSEAYTRAGDLHVTTGGLLQTGAGHLVIGDGGPVAIPPNSSLLIGSDGTISVQPIGQGPEALAIVDRIKLVNPERSELRKGNDGLLRVEDADIAAADASVRLLSGSIEHSNVNVAETLVNMIELSRQYEMQVKVMKTAKENADSSAKVLNVG